MASRSSDIRARAGGRPGVTKPPFPKIIPHSDGAGVIEAIGLIAG
jgi:NADPH2:quinone reductase